MRFDLTNFEKKIKVKFNKKSLLIKALSHKSINSLYNNEQLEFLGDRVIGLILANELLNLYPQEKEGILDKKFARLVNKYTCASIAKKLDIDKIFLKIKTINFHKQVNDKILSDACEALIGAIFLDKGFDFVKKFILYNWKYYLDESNKLLIDSKTRLQEYSLKTYKKLPTYKIVEQKGLNHNPTFKVSVKIKDSQSYTAKGHSIKEAQQNAAKLLLKTIN